MLVNGHIYTVLIMVMLGILHITFSDIHIKTAFVHRLTRFSDKRNNMIKPE